MSNERWPEGWIAERREIFVEDMSGDRHWFKFLPSLVTANGTEVKTRAVAQCSLCRILVEPDWDSLRLHGYRHIFLQIPFDAKGEVKSY